ncbi:lysine transporter LysE [Streptomyces sp. NPDC005761]|uniref:lysine transporter LysE n=1 Tax=Streptomyces sp. NPDC005761 TaxID=3157066 RepID=UPI0033DE97BD
MAADKVRERPWRRTREAGRGVREFVVEFVVETVGEILLSAAACLVLAGLFISAVWGWQQSPLLTGGLAALLTVFLCYGTWELRRPAGTSRRGRLAAVAACTATVAMFFGYYASSCSCG